MSITRAGSSPALGTMKKLKLSLIILVISCLVYFGAIFWVRSQNIECGGFAYKACSPGFVCQCAGIHPDATGSCVLAIDVFRFVTGCR